ncbi:MAG: tRNA pseudouridine(55) synthase TruB [Actinomycetota bacterium]|nr:tRNA pseudouridine(55) synthase TruB [Actinomycetota bacterium]MED5552413.1 tRNA pseudouridine(55) synthase TruB [Actinomycetota bacterium]MEE2680147.1 tRNA pseudouridine(55) synthase TruB [Actinomycetota bacterium]
MGRRPATVHGMLIVDKPAGMTSHDVVARLRKRLGERRIGHAGTLDPDATGVLVVGVGKATRLLRFASGSFKTYEVEIVFGTETDTLDASGEVVASHEMFVDKSSVIAAAKGLTGEIQQVAPMVSARRVNGRRLHDLAREGLEVERDARPVTVSRFDVEASEDPLIWRARIDCSAGTYVRTLGADLGTALGGGAHIRALRRVASGVYTLSEAGTIEEAPLRPVIELVRGIDQVVLNEQEQSLVRNGGKLGLNRTKGEGPWALVDTSQELIAVHENIDDRVVVGVVLPP